MASVKPAFIQQAQLALKQAFELSPWAQEETRQVIWQQFSNQGLPSQKAEAWRYSPLRRWYNLPPFNWQAGQWAGDQSLEEAGIHLVFIDGHYSNEHSTAQNTWPAGLSLEFRPAQLQSSDHDPFVALNAATTHQAWFLEITQNLGKPLWIHYVATQDTWSATQGYLFLAAGQEATLIEQTHGLASGAYQGLNLELRLKENAHLRHLRWFNQGGAESKIHSHPQILVARDASYQAFSLLNTPGLVRSEQEAYLSDENAQATMNSLTLGRGQSSQEARSITYHQAPYTTSNQLHKMILGDQSQGIFDGLIYVDGGAQKTNGLMENRNLLLSNEAQIETKPQLEIYADDVRCSHGVTTGELDENQAFYLRARGLDANLAKALLLQAFAFETVPDWVNKLNSWRQQIIHALGAYHA